MNCKNIFKFGVKKETVSPKIIKVEFQGKSLPQNVLLYVPYGMNINPTNESLVGLLADQGNESSLMGFVTDIANRETLEEGEISIKIPGVNSRVYFKADGTITVENDNGNFSLKPGGQFQANGFTVDP